MDNVNALGNTIAEIQAKIYAEGNRRFSVADKLEEIQNEIQRTKQLFDETVGFFGDADIDGDLRRLRLAFLLLADSLVQTEKKMIDSALEKSKEAEAYTRTLWKPKGK